MIFKTRKTWLVTALLFTLTACGESGSTTIDPEVKKASIAKISNYASNSDVEPSKQDYINAGVNSEELKFVDIEELNDLVETKESTEVDSEAELRILAQSIKDTTPPVITLEGKSTITIAINSTYNDAGATASDKGKSVSVTTDKSAIKTARLGKYNVVYTAVDKVGNKATKVRVVKVVEDSVPVITISTKSIKERGDLSSIVTVYDNEDSNLNVVVTGDTNTKITGIHHVVYTVTDSANHKVTKKVDVEVIPFTITELFNKSKDLKDVSYLVVGDSTRYYEGTNDVLINSRDSDKGYYKELLSPKNIKFMHTSIEGQRVKQWLEGVPMNRKGGKSFTIDDTLKKIDSVTPNHCIVEFSMGINDLIHNDHLDKAKLKSKIKISIEKLQAKKVRVLLVSPVPYDEAIATYRPSTSKELQEIYIDLREELSLDYISGYKILKAGYPGNARTDGLHPKVATSKELVREIFEQIENGSLD
jgi:predicted small lipoprotein YifL